MKRLAILGASSHGRVVADAARRAGWTSVTFFDDAPADSAGSRRVPVAGTTEDLVRRAAEFEGVVVAIGQNLARLAKQRSLAAAGLCIATVVHPSTVVSESAHLGAGCVLLAGAIVNPDATLGEACIVNTGATIDHDCVLGHAVHVSPGAHLGGTVTVGDAAWIGIGAAVKNGIRIGAGTVVGAGAAVISDVGDGAVVGGVPSRPLRRAGETR